MDDGPGTAGIPPSARATVRRHPERGIYDRAVIDAILDEALICHVGFIEDGVAVVIPTIHARVGDVVYLHGAAASRMLRMVGAGSTVSLTATLVDGIVAARSHFNHSMNYRSVVVFGAGRAVDDPDERMLAFRAIAEHVIPGRWEESRPPSPAEDRATAVVAISLEEASAKMRSGPPGDHPRDLDGPHWAGVIPLSIVAGEPEPAPDLRPGIPVPDNVRRYRRPGHGPGQ